MFNIWLVFISFYPYGHLVGMLLHNPYYHIVYRLDISNLNISNQAQNSTEKVAVACDFSLRTIYQDTFLLHKNGIWCELMAVGDKKLLVKKDIHRYHHECSNRTWVILKGWRNLVHLTFFRWNVTTPEESFARKLSHCSMKLSSITIEIYSERYHFSMEYLQCASHRGQHASTSFACERFPFVKRMCVHFTGIF